MICFGCSRLGIEKVFDDELLYQDHCNDAHQEFNGFVCPECDKKSTSWYNFHSHITTHREYCQPPWICCMKNTDTECGKKCSTRHNLIKHIQGYHQSNVTYNKKQYYRSSPNTHKHSKRNVVHTAQTRIAKCNEMETSSNATSNISTRKRRRKKKLRPKMDALQVDSNEHEQREPPRKRSRLDSSGEHERDSIQSQTRFLRVLYNAAIYVEGHESTSFSSLSPQSPSMDTE